MTHTMPDIAYAVSVVSQFMHAPNRDYLNVVFKSPFFEALILLSINPYINSVERKKFIMTRKEKSGEDNLKKKAVANN